jgi:hypothetical protein
MVDRREDAVRGERRGDIDRLAEPLRRDLLGEAVPRRNGRFGERASRRCALDQPRAALGERSDATRTILKTELNQTKNHQ